MVKGLPPVERKRWRLTPEEDARRKALDDEAKEYHRQYCIRADEAFKNGGTTEHDKEWKTALEVCQESMPPHQYEYLAQRTLELDQAFKRGEIDSATFTSKCVQAFRDADGLAAPPPQTRSPGDWRPLQGDPLCVLPRRPPPVLSAGAAKKLPS